MKLLAVLAFVIQATQIFGYGNKSICGKDDNRVPSNEPVIGRLLSSRTGSGGCTLTMISKSCAISAGHCKSVLKVAEFNTPDSIDGKIQHPQESDVYDIDKNSIKYKNGGPGNDWSVFKVLPNKITGEFAGNVQGMYSVASEMPEPGEILRITGFGLDRNEPTKNLTQQTNSGELISAGLVVTKEMTQEVQALARATLHHQVDTMGGNSGSTITSERTGLIVGIHTHGGCSVSSGKNTGTLIAGHRKLQKAIAACLRSDR